MKKKFSIYTKRGDEGMTTLIGGQKVRKTNVRIDAYGTVDELCSYVGLLVSSLDRFDEVFFLIHIQHRLFSIGGYLATDFQSTQVPPSCFISKDDVDQVESHIDNLDSQLPTLNRFILPGGCKSASISHICRTVCRRAERCIYMIEDESGVDIDSNLKQYINRLSDYFFVLSRYLNVFYQFKEIYWDNNCK